MAMTVQQLLDKLQNVEDKTQTVEVAVSTFNKRYPVAYCELYENGYDILKQVHNTHRIEINLPSAGETYMIVSTRKKKY